MNNKSLKVVALAIIMLVGINKTQVNKHTIANNNYIIAQAHFITEVVNNQNNLATKPNNKYIVELLNTMQNVNGIKWELTQIDIQNKTNITYNLRHALTLINNLSYKIQNKASIQQINQDFETIKQLIKGQ